MKMMSVQSIQTLILLFLLSRGLGLPRDLYDKHHSFRHPKYRGRHEDKIEKKSPQIVSLPLHAVVNEGDTVRLPCLVDSREGFSLAWRKNYEFIGDETKPNIHLEGHENGETLVIDQVNENDGGAYVCSLLVHGTSEIIHHVLVKGHTMEENDKQILKDTEESVRENKKLKDSADVKEINEETNDSEIASEAFKSDHYLSEDDNINDIQSMKTNEENYPSYTGNIYFARIPSFYTLSGGTDNSEPHRNQIIRHSPKSLNEFLELLRMYQPNLLTREQIKQFSQINFNKKTFPHNQLLRSTHTYNGNIRNDLHSIKGKEVGKIKGAGKSTENEQEMEQSDNNDGNDGKINETKKETGNKQEQEQSINNIDSLKFENEFQEKNMVKYDHENIKEEGDSFEQSVNSLEKDKEKVDIGYKPLDSDESISEEDVVENSLEDIESNNQIAESNVRDIEQEHKLNGDNQKSLFYGVRYLNPNREADTIEDEQININEKTQESVFRGHHLLETDLDRLGDQITKNYEDGSGAIDIDSSEQTDISEQTMYNSEESIKEKGTREERNQLEKSRETNLLKEDDTRMGHHLLETDLDRLGDQITKNEEEGSGAIDVDSSEQTIISEQTMYNPEESITEKGTRKERKQLEKVRETNVLKEEDTSSDTNVELHETGSGDEIYKSIKFKENNLHASHYYVPSARYLQEDELVNVENDKLIENTDDIKLSVLRGQYLPKEDLDDHYSQHVLYGTERTGDLKGTEYEDESAIDHDLGEENIEHKEIILPYFENSDKITADQETEHSDRINVIEEKEKLGIDKEDMDMRKERKNTIRIKDVEEPISTYRKEKYLQEYEQEKTEEEQPDDSHEYSQKYHVTDDIESLQENQRINENEMIPLTVKKSDDNVKEKSDIETKKKIYDPHPFRVICLTRKCDAK